MTAGRFAPSPTGPLHLGSLVAAAGSWLFARAAGARWLVRVEDIDTPRVIPGSADEILAALRLYGLEWDGDVVRQSERHELYREALRRLEERGFLFDCACSRAELQRTASAPAGREPVYPGTCRDGVGGRRARAVRFRVPDGRIAFEDAVFGRVEDDLRRDVGDFVVRRADAIFAYQLAVVVDDAEQGITQVVRGADLLASTSRQIALQRALGAPTPSHAHLPLVVNADGAKLGKRDGALPLPSLDRRRVQETLALAFRILGIAEIEPAVPSRMLEQALARFDPASIGPEPFVLDERTADGLDREIRPAMANSYDVRNNEDESRFEATVDGATAFAEYSLDGDTIRFTHTEVPPALEGRGLASAIVKTALDDARSRNLQVVPQCAYVRSWINRHEEYQDLVAT